MTALHYRTKHAVHHRADQSAEWQQHASAIETSALKGDANAAFTVQAVNISYRLEQRLHDTSQVLDFDEQRRTNFLRALTHAFDARPDEFPHDGRTTAHAVAENIFQPLHNTINEIEYRQLADTDLASIPTVVKMADFASIQQADVQFAYLNQQMPDIDHSIDYDSPRAIRDFVDDVQERNGFKNRILQQTGFNETAWQTNVIESASGWAHIYASRLETEAIHPEHRSAIYQAASHLPGIGGAIQALHGALPSDQPDQTAQTRKQEQRYLRAYCQALAFAASN